MVLTKLSNSEIKQRMSAIKDVGNLSGQEKREIITHLEISDTTLTTYLDNKGTDYCRNIAIMDACEKIIKNRN